MHTCHPKIWVTRTEAKVNLLFPRHEMLTLTLPGSPKKFFPVKKRICLAITEPDAGSDVAAFAIEVVLISNGKHYKVSGQKKV